MDSTELNALIEQARDGDKDAWRRLFLHLQPTLLNQAQRLLGPAWHALSPQDLVQITWTSATQRLPSYRGEGFLAWLSVIMRNAHRNLVRDPRRRLDERRVTLAAPALPDLNDAGGHEPPVDESSVLSELLAHEETALVRQALAAIDPQCREVLELWMAEPLSLAALAKRLGLTARVARARFHDGIHQLQQQLKELRP